MKFFKWLAASLLVMTLLACGGGGGSAGGVVSTGGTGGTGSTGSTGGSSTVSISTPTLVLSIVDGSGNVVNGNSISGGLKRAKAVLKKADGSVAAFALVSFSASNEFAILNPSSGAVLTDVNGVAQVLIQPASFNVSGGALLSANANIENFTAQASLAIQASSANVTLGVLSPNSPILSAYQSTAVELPVLVDGLPSTAGQVNVGFSSPCGSFSPPTVNTGSNGKAQTTFTSTGCTGGTVTLNASASGAGALASTAVNILAPTATNLQFVSAMPQTIFSQQALFGDKQSVVIFKLVDSAGFGIDGQTIELSLSGSAIASGVVFADSGGTTVTQATANGGFVSLNIKSGDVPTPVAINGYLLSNPFISASSGGLVVNSGAPAQNFFSISASSYNIEGLNFDGEVSTITIRTADRLAQPVPNGTVISFIAEGGQIVASCATAIDTNGFSGCSTAISSQISRPIDGRVSLLAYAEGLEAFVDDNGDNKWNIGESFADMGQPFLDSNENGSHDPSEQKIGSSDSAGIGTQTCAATAVAFGFIPQSVPNTCSSTHGKAIVRAQAVIAFSGSFAANPPTIISLQRTRYSFILSDQNGNAMPQGSQIEASVTGGIKCTVDRVVPAKVASTPNPTAHTVILKADTSDPNELGTCRGAILTTSVKTPKNNETLFPDVTMP